MREKHIRFARHQVLLEAAKKRFRTVALILLAACLAARQRLDKAAVIRNNFV